MESLLEDAFDYMAGNAFWALKLPKLMEYNFKAFKKVLKLHKQTYVKRKAESPQNLGAYLTLSEQEEMIEEYCNTHQISSKRISIIMEYAIAVTAEEKYYTTIKHF
ncbi:unnamed protein product [Sphagnum balticum]|jgi:hypothetical protein